LTTATGTLRVTPPDGDAPAIGSVHIGVDYRPDTTRGFTYIQLMPVDAPLGDLGYSARALEGRFPLD
jgi:hypothetical protein